MPRFGPIDCVTIAAPDLAVAVDAYHRYLGYQVVARGTISASLAESWARPALLGRHYALMLPEGNGQTYLRFVESKPAPRYMPFRHMGWNAAEFMVQDTDAIAAKLANSPFRIIGPPADLSFSDKIRAMQAIGPCNESIYLTSFKEKLAAFDTPDATHFVDRVFIVICGGPSVAELNAFYARHFGVAIAAVIPAIISVLSNAHGMASDSKHDLAAIALHGQSYIEADSMPAGTLARDSIAGELPPGIASVSFGIDSLQATTARFLAPPRALSEAPYRGRRAATCVGAGGELIELVEQSA